MSDAKGALALLSSLPPAKILLGDKGYDADWFRAALAERGISACIPARRGRRNGSNPKAASQRVSLRQTSARGRLQRQLFW